MSKMTNAIPHQEDPINEQIESAEFYLICAQSHLNELRAKKAAQDAEDAHVDAQYQEYLEIEYGKLVISSDAADKEIEREIALKYPERHPHGERHLGTISSEEPRESEEVSDDIPF